MHLPLRGSPVLAPPRYLAARTGGWQYPCGMRHPLPAAVLWDMDGTLVDTEPYWIAAEMALAARDGGSWNVEDGYALIGRDLRDSAHILRAKGGIRGSDDEIIADLLHRVIAQVREHGVPWRAGARDLLLAVRAAQVPCALVTMSYRSLADEIIAQLPHGTFQAVITGDMVTHGKPHPEPYLLAAAELGVDPTRCLAIEDSRTGLASAEAAGATTIAVQLHVALDRAPGRSRLSALEDLTLDDLRDIAAGVVVDRLDP